MKTVVWIVGAGPTGLSLALFLKKKGVDVMIFDKNKKTTPYSKAMIVHARTLEIFDDLGVADQFTTKWERLQKVKFLNDKNNKVTFNFSVIGKGSSKFPFGVFIEQSKTEKILVKQLEKLWVKIHRDHDFVSYKELKDKVVLNFTGKKSYKVDYLVGCDGASSPVRHQLGYKFEWSTLDERFYVADVKIKSKVINKRQLYIKFAGKKFCLIFPINREKKHYRIIGILPHEYRTKKDLKFSDIHHEVIEGLNLHLEVLKTNWFSTYRVHSRYCHFGKWKIFLAGDAAHIHSPAWWRGMNTGIQDSYNLAWKLADVINNKANPQILDSYDQERYPIAVDLIKTSDRLFGYMSSSVIFSFIYTKIILRIMLFIINKWWINHRVFPFLSMLTISYKQSDLMIQSRLGSLNAGQRLPYHADIYKKTLWKDFVILNHGISVSKHDSSIYDIIDIPDSFSLQTNYYIILRPDKHIAYIWSNPKKIADYFDRFS